MTKTQGIVRQISSKLCSEFQRVVPLQPPKQTKQGKWLSEEEIKTNSEAALKRFYDVSRNEIHAASLGVIGRARVAFDLQQRLIDAGYAPTLVKQVLFSMLISVFIGK